MNPLFLSLTTLLLFLITTTTATPKIGVIFDPIKPNLPPLDSVVTSLVHHKISTVRLINPTSTSISSFSSTNINLIISVPNTFLRSFATNQSSSVSWIVNNVLPFHNTTRISLISIDTTNHDITSFYLPALRNLYSNLLQLGIVNVPVSVTFGFESILDVKDWFTPSQSYFYEPLLIRSLVRFLKSINAPFLVTLYPYNVFHSGYNEIPLGFALFNNDRFTIRTDVFTGIEYSNLFDMMVDAVVFALEGVGEGDVRVIIAETGWPSETIEVKSDVFYLNGLMDHLKKSGSRRVDEVYVHELFGDEWGIMDEEMRFKYKDLDFEVVTSDFTDKLVLCFCGLGLVLVIVTVGLRKLKMD